MLGKALDIDKRETFRTNREGILLILSFEFQMCPEFTLISATGSNSNGYDGVLPAPDAGVRLQ